MKTLCLRNQDIPASENTNFYMFKNLLPDRNYTLSVSMRNGVGEGPPATTLVSTPPEPTGTRTVLNLPYCSDGCF